ncbi:hypothetical protein BC936DRAFT_139249 [Jimgerdemannia flammicorona]|uniref:Uncharacterized protein n=1 Tax=Jimgerdemannia flammicorona TaxID=994334 RepID=A0A433BAH0_9FUNG|nr:hypothetical protein BC936DRAFT_139249 [Jimgerdemannia flammicorona]
MNSKEREHPCVVSQRLLPGLGRSRLPSGGLGGDGEAGDSHTPEACGDDFGFGVASDGQYAGICEYCVGAECIFE